MAREDSKGSEASVGRQGRACLRRPPTPQDLACCSGSLSSFFSSLLPSLLLLLIWYCDNRKRHCACVHRHHYGEERQQKTLKLMEKSLRKVQYSRWTFTRHNFRLSSGITPLNLTPHAFSRLTKRTLKKKEKKAKAALDLPKIWEHWAITVGFHLVQERGDVSVNS